MTVFQYHPDILAAYPALTGGVIVASGLANGPSAGELRARYAKEQADVVARIGATPLSELESLAAWRGAFRAFGVDPTQYRSAAEALLRRLTKKGDIPSISTLVDIGNLVSIRYGLPVAVFDRASVALPITVHFAAGTEPFTILGAEGVEYPAPGEVVFTDASGAVVARRWCWRQSEASAARATTTDVVVTVEAHHGAGPDDVRAALDDLVALLSEFGRGTCETAVLGRDRAAF